MEQSLSTEESAPTFAFGVDYYQLVFIWISTSRKDEIHRALLDEPNRLFKRFFSTFEPGTEFFGAAGHADLQRYLTVLEDALRDILSKHSIQFWLHMYRRIAPVLSSLHNNKTDENTTALVRDIVECAIAKFARRDTMREVRLSGSVPPGQVLGGLFLRQLKKSIRDRRTREAYIESLRRRDEFVLCDFKIKDFIAMYAVEGLAYEYWQASARLRTVGKGAKLALMGGALIYHRDAELEGLIDSFDERISLSQIMHTSSGGILAPSIVEAARASVFATRYNVSRDPADELCADLGVAAASDLPVFNFLPNLIPLRSIEEGHDFLSGRFADYHGYSLHDFLLVVAALSWRAAFPERALSRYIDGHGMAIRLCLAQVLRRGYTVVHPELESISRSVLFYLQYFFQKEGGPLPDAQIVKKVLADLTLDSEEKQARVSLWTRGPRFLLLASDGVVTIDTPAIGQLINTLFVRLRHSAQKRGDLFEELVRQHLRDSGHELLVRNLRAGEIDREVDSVIRVGTTLWLIEAFSMERPLDFEIGKPSVIEMRVERLKEKLEQARSLRELVVKTPVGTNYDFSWATDIEYCVVSPFIEWVWARDPSLWINGDTPRILSIAELLRHLDPEDLP